MLQPIPYLSLDGNYADAMRFKEHADRVVHGRLVLPGGASLPMFWAKI